MTNQIRTICVFCGAGTGNTPIYAQVAEELGKEMVRRGIGLVYGGGTVGLMGVTAHSVQQAGGRVLGIIPDSLRVRELVSEEIGELMVVESMAERKLRMFECSDAFITMPGGYGTLDELFEAVTFGQLGVHAKPVGLLNVNGYFDPLLQWIDQAIEAGFVRAHHRALILVHTEPAALIDALQSYQPPKSLVNWKK